MKGKKELEEVGILGWPMRTMNRLHFPSSERMAILEGEWELMPLVSTRERICMGFQHFGVGVP